jgi:hypothetical protein
MHKFSNKLLTKVPGLKPQEMDSLFNNWSIENWLPTSKRIKFDPYSTSYTKINSKWIKDFIVRHKTVRVLEENMD